MILCTPDVCSMMLLAFMTKCKAHQILDFGPRIIAWLRHCILARKMAMPAQSRLEQIDFDFSQPGSARRSTPLQGRYCTTGLLNAEECKTS